jgi:hypothetical protein
LLLSQEEASRAVSNGGLAVWVLVRVVSVNMSTVWMVGVNIYPKENDLSLPFAPTNICPFVCLDGGVNVDVDERGRAGPTTNLLQFATF